MPPNLGGFFMVRSYYPSECHADYFDFERIEALKPAIEACGISTLSQSPMLGFHKQMDNRIKLLEEILSFRMQGVEFDNGDMYVDGHKAASDVRDEFVSVTEKLMEELAQCYNVLPQLDIKDTIDHRPEGDEITSLKWLETNNLFNNLIQRNQSAAFSSGKVRPNHETNINIIARRTGKDVNSHTVLDGIITTIMATIQRINIIGSREGSRNRRRLKANQTGKKFRVGIKSNISTNRNNLISGVDRCIHLNAMKKKIGRAVQQECRDRSRMPSSA